MPHRPKTPLPENAIENPKNADARKKVLVLRGRARRGDGGQEAREDVAGLLLLDGLGFDGGGHAHGHLVLGRRLDVHDRGLVGLDVHDGLAGVAGVGGGDAGGRGGGRARGV